MDKYTKEYFIECGKKGGHATASKKDHEHYLKIGKMGGLKRWHKKEDKKSNDDNTIVLNN